MITISQFTIIAISLFVVLVVILFLPVSYDSNNQLKQKVLIKPMPQTYKHNEALITQFT
jgi:hypothetical protein